MSFEPGSITWGRSADGRLVPISVSRAYRAEHRPKVTPEQRQAVINGFNAGLTYSQIARDLDISRNSIAGIIFRARTAGTGLREKSQRQMRTVCLVTPQAPPKPKAEPTRAATEYTPARVSFFDIANWQCRWPLWAANAPFSEKFFCGNEVKPGQSYCEHCYGLSTAPHVTRSVDKRLNLKKLARAA